jgi:uracil-DNA glycosylase
MGIPRGAEGVRGGVKTAAALRAVHAKLDACKKCKSMVGPVVHGPPVSSRVFLLGQAPGPHEYKFGRPFAWTAGKTMFKWFERHLGVDEETFRARVYMAAVARCFPGKAKGGGDRKPDEKEIANCRPWLEREVAILKPKLLLPVGTLAIEQVLGTRQPLIDVVGKPLRTQYLGTAVDVVCLPHPSGASTWHRKEPGISLLEAALQLISHHAVMRETLESA